MSDETANAPDETGAPVPAAELGSAPQEPATPTGSPEAEAGSQRMAELQEMMADQHGEYWKRPELQDEYRSLAEADERGLDFDMTEPKNLEVWSGHLGVEPEQVLDGMERAQQITNEVGDTGELETAFEGLPDRVQWACRQALAAPERRLDLVRSLTDAEYEQLGTFLDGMTEPEQQAVKNALGL